MGKLLEHLRQFLNEGSYFPDFKTTVKTDLPLRNGEIIPAGTEVLCDFNTDSEQVFYIRYDGRSLTVDVSVAHRYLNGFSRQPKNLQLQHELEQNDGRCTTPLGNIVDANGHGPFGEPSWMRILNKVDQQH